MPPESKEGTPAFTTENIVNQTPRDVGILSVMASILGYIRIGLAIYRLKIL